MNGSSELFLVLALLAFAASISVAFIGSQSYGRHAYRRDCRARALHGFAPADPLPFELPTVATLESGPTHRGRVSPDGAAAPKTSGSPDVSGRALLLDVPA